MLHRISGSLFTLEEAKGHGLRDDQGWRGKGLCLFTRLPRSEPCEGSGSEPGVLLQAQAGADLAGFLVLRVQGTLRFGNVLPSQLHRGLFSAPRLPPSPHPRLPLWPASLASCRSAGLCSRPALPGRSPQAGPGSWNSCRQEASPGVTEGLADPHFHL